MMGVKHVSNFSFPPEFGFTGSAGKSTVGAHMRSKPMKHGGSMKVGGGGRFAKLKGELSREKGIKNPGALAASIGRKKYGNAKMSSMAAKHRYKEGGAVDAGEYAETEPDLVAPGRADQFKKGGHAKHHYAKGGDVKAGGREQFKKGGSAPGPEKREHEGQFEDYKSGGKAKHRYAQGGQVQRDEREADKFKRGGKC
jgi:hypothetical protein